MLENQSHAANMQSMSNLLSKIARRYITLSLMESAVVLQDKRRSVKTACINLQSTNGMHVCGYTYMLHEGVFPLKKLLGQISPIHRPTNGHCVAYESSAPSPVFIGLHDSGKPWTLRTGNLYSAEQHRYVGSALKNTGLAHVYKVV